MKHWYNFTCSFFKYEEEAVFNKKRNRQETVNYTYSEI